MGNGASGSSFNFFKGAPSAYKPHCKKKNPGGSGKKEKKAKGGKI
jgi:hypothetical protein